MRAARRRSLGLKDADFDAHAKTLGDKGFEVRRTQDDSGLADHRRAHRRAEQEERQRGAG